MIIAAMAGIPVLLPEAWAVSIAARESFDISADLEELSRPM